MKYVLLISVTGLVIGGCQKKPVPEIHTTSPLVDQYSASPGQMMEASGGRVRITERHFQPQEAGSAAQPSHTTEGEH